MNILSEGKYFYGQTTLLKFLLLLLLKRKKWIFLIKHSYAFRESRWLNSGSYESSESI